MEQKKPHGNTGKNPKRKPAENLLTKRVMVGFTESEYNYCKEAHKKLNPNKTMPALMRDVFIEYLKTH